MKYIKEYKEFSELDLISDESIDVLDNEIIMSLLYKYT